MSEEKRPTENPNPATHQSQIKRHSTPTPDVDATLDASGPTPLRWAGAHQNPNPSVPTGCSENSAKAAWERFGLLYRRLPCGVKSR